jgi:hypothetical protein
MIMDGMIFMNNSRTCPDSNKLTIKTHSSSSMKFDFVILSLAKEPFVPTRSERVSEMEPVALMNGMSLVIWTSVPMMSRTVHRNIQLPITINLKCRFSHKLCTPIKLNKAISITMNITANIAQKRIQDRDKIILLSRKSAPVITAWTNGQTKV